MSAMASMTIVSTSERCACGCGELCRPGSKYADYEKCRQRAYRRKLQDRLRAAGLPDHLNLEMAGDARARHGDAQKPSRKRSRRSPDLRISYRKAVEAVAEKAAATDWVAEERAHMWATDLLSPLLTDRQRTALKGRS